MDNSRLSPRTPSSIRDGVIVPPTNLELVVSDHCNIACRQCNHASPIMKKWNASVSLTERVLGSLSKVYHCKRLRLLGGEPLLNPNIVELIQVAKRSGVADIIQMTTNGILLDRLPDEGWDSLDEVELSLYDISKLTDEDIEAKRQKGKSHGTLVEISRYPNFRMTFTSQKATNPALVEEVWSACKMVNVWGCHTLRSDRLYRCPQSIYVPGFTGGHLEQEGFAISDSPSLRDDLLEYLNAPGPLASCAHCVGSCGKQFAQEGVDRKTWRDDLDVAYEDMIDFDLLERSKTEMEEIDDCRKPVVADRKPKGIAKRLRALWGQ